MSYDVAVWVGSRPADDAAAHGLVCFDPQSTTLI